MSLQFLRKNPALLSMRRISVSLPIGRRNESTSAVLPLGKTKTQMSQLERPKVIAVSGPADITPVSGVPQEHIKERLVRIYQTPKNAMQSGTNNVNKWELEFETRERWENPLMGWTSTGDPHSNLKVQFSSKEEAIQFANKNGYAWFVEPTKKVAPKVKSYGYNFSWNKRTRASTK